MMRGMKRRLFTTVLWFYASWYAGAVIAHFAGVNPILGPILGMAAASLIAIDPRGIVWSARRSSGAPAQAQHEPV